MSMPSLSVKNPVLMNLLVLLVFIAGIMAYRNMAKDQYPDVAMAGFAAVTIMPGASPKEVEQLLTIPIEEELAKMDDIETMQSTSSEGISMVMMQFNRDSEENFEIVTEAQNKINQVQRLPSEAEPTFVEEMKPPFFTATVAVLGNAPEKEVKEFVDSFEERLKNLPGVAEVRISGLREREVWVEVDPNRLYSYGLSLSDVARALGRRNLNLQGGMIRMPRGEFAVRTEAEYRDLEDIKNTIVREGQAGSGYVYVHDIARVRDTFEDRRTLARLDGSPSINLVITKDRESNTVTLVERIRELVDEFAPRMPAGMSMKVVDDASIEVRSRLRGPLQQPAFGPGPGGAVDFCIHRAAPGADGGDWHSGFVSRDLRDDRHDRVLDQHHRAVQFDPGDWSGGG